MLGYPPGSFIFVVCVLFGFATKSHCVVQADSKSSCFSLLSVRIAGLTEYTQALKFLYNRMWK